MWRWALFPSDTLCNGSHSDFPDTSELLREGIRCARPQNVGPSHTTGEPPSAHGSSLGSYLPAFAFQVVESIRLNKKLLDSNVASISDYLAKESS